MTIFEKIFAHTTKAEWFELDAVYTAQRLENICAFCNENNIPYKMRTASMLSAANIAPYSGAAAGCMWYLAVHPCDVNRVQHYISAECDY